MAAPAGNQFWKLRSAHGRKPMFESPEALWEACCEYFQWVVDTPMQEERVFVSDGTVIRAQVPKMRAMTVQGLCLHLGVSQQTWYEWEKDEGFSEIASRARRVIYVQKFEGAAAGLLNANIIARELGLKEASSHEHSGPNGGPLREIRRVIISPSMSADEAAQAYKEFMNDGSGHG